MTFKKERSSLSYTTMYLVFGSRAYKKDSILIDWEQLKRHESETRHRQTADKQMNFKHLILRQSRLLCIVQRPQWRVRLQQSFSEHFPHVCCLCSKHYPKQAAINELPGISKISFDLLLSIQIVPTFTAVPRFAFDKRT